MKLETRRLILRDWKSEDAEDLVSGINNINISKWLGNVPFPYNIEDARNFVEYAKILNTKEKSNSYEFAIVLKSENKVIGGVSLLKIDYHHRTSSCGGIWINENYHGQGFGLEAFNEKIRFAFEDLKLRRLENGFFPGNEGSKKMQLKLGYQIEGLKRQVFCSLGDGKIKDEYVTGLLSQEWIKASS